ncbi:hypothetical protein MAPG_09524 [Magnaporthiopsis poae ATCC 64411]|uniref:GH16 domain-containing protein n=1 Tax=Magnaporthiopsis poae (strain ATCC 64411 / 73-15) TaxID=644358 RepID=A0A0C4EA65_MAGP6|nr:hypothetical protein MAPG_09524 [Magnaporthiopsis poae ATCC 64411]
MMPLGHLLLRLVVGLAALPSLAQAAEAACYCPRPEGLSQRHYGVDFRTPPSADLTDYWHASSGSNITRDGDRGAGLQYVNRHDAPQIETDFHIWYGRVDFDLQAAPGRGVITSAALKPNEGEGVHWGWSGNDFGQDQGLVQTNVPARGGVTGNNDRRIWEAVDNPQGSVHTYSIDWTPEKIDWLIDGNLVNTRLAADADRDGEPFPQTPSRVQFGVWAGGDPSNGPGVVDWAGGQTDTQDGPYAAYLRKVSITNYNPAGTYEYAENPDGTMSVRPINSPSRGGPGDAQSLGTNNPSRQPLLVGLPRSERGTCGAGAGKSCQGSPFGECCSRYGYCGNSAEFCGSGCQSAYGLCSTPSLFNQANKPELDRNPVTRIASVSSSPQSTAAPSLLPSGRRGDRQTAFGPGEISTRRVSLPNAAPSSPATSTQRTAGPHRPVRLPFSRGDQGAVPLPIIPTPSSGSNAVPTDLDGALPLAAPTSTSSHRPGRFPFSSRTGTRTVLRPQRASDASSTRGSTRRSPMRVSRTRDSTFSRPPRTSGSSRTRSGAFSRPTGASDSGVTTRNRAASTTTTTTPESTPAPNGPVLGTGSSSPASTEAPIPAPPEDSLPAPPENSLPISQEDSLPEAPENPLPAPPENSIPAPSEASPVPIVSGDGDPRPGPLGGARPAAGGLDSNNAVGGSSSAMAGSNNGIASPTVVSASSSTASDASVPDVTTSGSGDPMITTAAGEAAASSGDATFVSSGGAATTGPNDAIVTVPEGPTTTTSGDNTFANAEGATSLGSEDATATASGGAITASSGDAAVTASEVVTVTTFEEAATTAPGRVTTTASEEASTISSGDAAVSTSESGAAATPSGATTTSSESATVASFEHGATTGPEDATAANSESFTTTSAPIDAAIAPPERVVATTASDSTTVAGFDGAATTTRPGDATVATPVEPAATSASDSATNIQEATTTDSEDAAVTAPEESTTTSTPEDTQSLPTVATPDSEQATTTSSDDATISPIASESATVTDSDDAMGATSASTEATTTSSE